MQIAKIVSGGQTGVDRGAIAAALERGFPYGGMIPKGRRAEDGIVPLAFADIGGRGSDPSVYVLLYMLNDKKWARQIARHLAAECAAHFEADERG